MKFIASFLAIGLIPFLIITVITLNVASSALEKGAFDKLEAVREIKKNQVLDYFESIKNQLYVLQNDPEAAVALNELKKTFDPNNPTAITNAWKAIEDKYDSYFSHIMKTNGWYDLFLIDTEGHIIYTVAMESDLGQYVTAPDVAGSGLDTNITMLKGNPSLEVATSDFKPYTPSAGDPAAFMTTRLKNKSGKLVGYLALQVPLDQINKIMKERSGMGETGETYLVGSDKLMRSDSFLDPVHHTVIASFKNPAKGSVDTEAARSALAGKTDNKIIIDYNGNPVLSAFTPLDFLGQHWALIAEIDEPEAFEASDSLTMIAMITAAIAAALILLVAILMTRSITLPIHKMVAFIKHMAEGDLRGILDIHSKDEIGEVAGALNQMSDDFNTNFRQIMNDATTLANSSTELSAISTQLANAATEMNSQSTTVAGATDQMSANINTMASAAEELSANTQTISASATEMNQNMQTSRTAVETMAEAIGEVAKQAQNAETVSNEARAKSVHTTEVMGSLNQSASEIGEVTALIKEIAQQTNLLALNANIEAASAGEAGKGFAVVANEIKELANQSQKAAEEIAQKISDIQQRTEESVTNIKEMTTVIHDVADASKVITESTTEQTKTSDHISQNINESALGVEEISRLIEEMANAARNIAANSGELSSGANEVSSNINGISTASGETASGANQVQSESQNLSQIATALQSVVQKFQLRS